MSVVLQSSDPQDRQANGRVPILAWTSPGGQSAWQDTEKGKPCHGMVASPQSSPGHWKILAKPKLHFPVSLLSLKGWNSFRLNMACANQDLQHQAAVPGTPCSPLPSHLLSPGLAGEMVLR